MNPFSLVALCLLLGQHPGKTEPTRLELTVSPAATAVPVLRYELLPTSKERTPGNAALGYTKALLLLPNLDRDEGAKIGEKVELWLKNREKFPKEEVTSLLKRYQEALTAAEEASRRESCDWQLSPEAWNSSDTKIITRLRELHRMLLLKAALETAHDRPLESLKTLSAAFQMGRHVAEGKSSLYWLMGATLVDDSLLALESLVQHPQTPNLGAALELFPPLEVRDALHAEGRLFETLLPEIKELENGPIELSRAEKIHRTIMELLESRRGVARGEGTLAEVDTAEKTAYRGPLAKKELIARGHAAKDVERMPNLQAALLFAAVEHREAWDEGVKLFSLPLAQLQGDEMQRVFAKWEEIATRHDRNALFRAYSSSDDVLKSIYRMRTVTSRRVAQLRVLEAVRNHVARKGSPPRSLDDLPNIPDNPCTGKPFAYRTTNEGFLLIATAPHGDKQWVREYVVTLRPTKK